MDKDNIEVSDETLSNATNNKFSKDSRGRADQEALTRIYNDLDDVSKQELLRYAVLLRRKSVAVLV